MSDTSTSAPSGGFAGATLVWAVCALALALSAGALFACWRLHERTGEIERELVRRQQAASEQAFEAGVLAKQAQELVRESAGRVSLLETRVNELSLQRDQLESLVQTLSRSREENVLNDVEAALRVAAQQASITGSVEPLVAALRAAEERIGKLSQPRLDRVRRALVHDLEKVRSTTVPDLGVVLVRLDEIARALDELPLLAERPHRASADGAARLKTVATGASTEPPASWMDRSPWLEWRKAMLDNVQQLFSVHKMANPEAALLTPEQGFFLRENAKLRLLNARLAILSRQSEGGKADLHAVTSMVDRYFDKSAKPTRAALEALKQVSQQVTQTGLPQPDETLTAIAALSAGR